jgi:hypothetical protein
VQEEGKAGVDEEGRGEGRGGRRRRTRIGGVEEGRGELLLVGEVKNE